MCAQQDATDSVFESKEFQEYEREFAKYMSENERNLCPEQDFNSVLQEPEDVLREKISTLVEWWRNAKHVVVYTGAGISTAAGLPDYRGPEGVWTRKLRGEDVDETLELFGYEPTLAHDALARLYKAGFLAHVCTTNLDNLHSKSGLPKDALSELHGNSFVEECSSCGMTFKRAFLVRNATGLFEHGTGRACEKCGGPLRDNIVNFGNTFAHVPSMEAQHDQAWIETIKADLVVVLGSSLSVQSSCDLPEECIAPRGEKSAGGRLVIVNQQKTPKDSLASLRLSATCDEAMGPLAAALLAEAPT